MQYKTAYSDPVYRRLVRLARPFYNYTGPNDWSHIQDVRRRAAAMAHKLYGRGLTPAEYAAVLFHDSTKHEMGADNHGRTAGVRAARILAAALLPEQVDEAVEAISVHDDNLDKFPTQTAELLAAADANPPDLGFVLDKGWRYGVKHGFDEDQQIANLSSDDGVTGMYRRGGSFNYSKTWDRYWGKKGDAYKDALSKLYGDKERMRQALVEHGLLQKEAKDVEAAQHDVKPEWLYTYLPRHNSVDTDGILSTRLSPAGWEKYVQRTGKATKEEVLDALDAWNPEFKRSMRWMPGIPSSSAAWASRRLGSQYQTWRMKGCWNLQRRSVCIDSMPLSCLLLAS